MIERITKNKKTTALGLIIILGSLILVGIEKATLTEAAAFIVAGIGCLFAKDDALKKQ
jgi:hypothetical protein